VNLAWRKFAVFAGEKRHLCCGDGLSYPAQLKSIADEKWTKWANPTQNFEWFGLYPNTISYKDIVISE
jgi:hypothetical protein